MNNNMLEKGKADMAEFIGPGVPVVPITPRLMRVVPLNITKVIGNFEDFTASLA